MIPYSTCACPQGHGQVQLSWHLYLDDIMSGQVRWRLVSFLRALPFCLFSWGFLILILSVLLAGHQRVHQSSTVPGESAIEDLLPERRESGKKWSGQKMGPGVESRNHPQKTERQGSCALGTLEEGDATSPSFAWPGNAFTMTACPAGAVGP